MINPIPNHARNHAQLLFVIPVSKYIQVINPISGIKEYFLINVITLSAMALSQNIINEILGVARSIKLIFPSAYSLFELKSKLNISVKYVLDKLKAITIAHNTITGKTICPLIKGI